MEIICEEFLNSSRSIPLPASPNYICLKAIDITLWRARNSPVVTCADLLHSMNRKGMVGMGYYKEDSCLFHYKKSKKIKVSTVCFEKTVQSINDITIPAPVGIDIDDSTGRLIAKTYIEIISKPNLTANIEKNVLIIEGLLPVKIIFENPKACPCSDEFRSICQEAIIPIQTVISTNDNNTCDHRPGGFDCNDNFEIQTKAKVISTSIFGFPNKYCTAAGKQISLILKAILEITVYILEDEVIDLCDYYHFDKY